MSKINNKLTAESTRSALQISPEETLNQNGLSESIQTIFSNSKPHIKWTRSSYKTHRIYILLKNLKKTIKSFLINLSIIAQKSENIALTVLSKSDKNPKILTRDALNKLIKNEKRSNKNTILNLKQILVKNGYSSTISNLSFKKHSFKSVFLDGINFRSCTFNEVSFSNHNIKNTKFESCKAYNVSFSNSLLIDCAFKHCRMRETMFTNASLKNVKFSYSSLVCSSFEDANFNNSDFSECKLPGTHFLQATAKLSRFKSCFLTDTVFFGAHNQFQFIDSTGIGQMTRPIVAFLVDLESRGITTPKAFFHLGTKAKAIPIRIAMQAQKVDHQQLTEEVENALKDPLADSKQPVPQWLLEKIRQPNSQSQIIIEKANQLAKTVDGIYLPGGEDLPPSLYGEDEKTETNWGNDYRRSLLELGLIHYSASRGIPIMAICRGFQMVNIYYGARLDQHVQGQRGIQVFQPSDKTHKGLLYNPLKQPLKSTVFHHQAISLENKAPEHLETVTEYDGFIKAVEAGSGAARPLIGLQYHPEFLNAPTAHSLKREMIDTMLSIRMSEANNAYWKIFLDSMLAFRTKKKMSCLMHLLTEVKIDEA